MIGAVWSYGNSTMAPYAELFSVGGANSIRAFGVRTLGPGSYHPAASQWSYVDQVGNLKFEANLEWRFPIIGKLMGAVFLDAGNVWLMVPDDQRPGGVISADSFLREIALGTGAGLRYDLSFLVLRFDVGVGLHAPFDTGRSGYYNMPRFKDSLGFHLAVGYPF
jgi:outer membrane protein assembly factor BamA